MGEEIVILFFVPRKCPLRSLTSFVCKACFGLIVTLTDEVAASFLFISLVLLLMTTIPRL